jgi:hypothetical protein
MKICRTKVSGTAIKWKPLLAGTIETSHSGRKEEAVVTKSYTGTDVDLTIVSPPRQSKANNRQGLLEAGYDFPIVAKDSSATCTTTASSADKTALLQPSLFTTNVSRSTSTATMSTLSDSNHTTSINGSHNGSVASTSHRSREPRLLPQHVEDAGVDEIMRALSDAEREALSDANMPLRHFRAEKGDVAKAVAKCKSTLAWRQTFGVKHIISSFNEEDSGESKDEKDQEGKQKRQGFKKMLLEECTTGKVYVRGRDKVRHYAVVGHRRL